MVQQFLDAYFVRVGEKGKAKNWIHSFSLIVRISDGFRQTVDQTLHLFLAILIDMLVDTLDYLFITFSLEFELGAKSVNCILE